jgi:hypothetical protein
LDVGEYGLAFEILCEIMKEKDRAVSIDTLSKLHELAKRMEKDPSWRSNIGQKE